MPILNGPALCTHRAIGKPEADKNAPDSGEAAKQRKQDLPVLDRGMLDLRNTLGDEAPNELLEAVHRIKCTNNEGLLVTLVPHCREEDEGRLAHAFEDTEKCTDNDETGEVLAESRARKNDSP